MADYFESGYAVRKPSWHSKELLLAEYPESWDDARRSAGLLWEPTLQPLYRKIRTVTPATDEWGRPTSGAANRLPDGSWAIVHERYEEADAQEVVRDDTGDVLGTVSGSFELLLHSQMGPIIEAILGHPNAKFDTAGSARGGKLVYVTVLLDEPVSIGGDSSPTIPYLVLLNSHDGSGACKVLFTFVRVVCANTFQMASDEGDRTGAQFSFRHTSGMADRIAEAKTALRGARSSLTAWRAEAEQLGTLRVDDDIIAAFEEQFIPMPPTGIITDRVRSNVMKDRAKFHSLLGSRTNAAEAGTGLQLVNAAIEYLDFSRGFRNAETLMGRQILRPEPLKQKAIKLVRELVPA